MNGYELLVRMLGAARAWCRLSVRAKRRLVRRRRLLDCRRRTRAANRHRDITRLLERLGCRLARLKADREARQA